MNTYDIVVIGAGPAGGQCARQLASTGKRVLLAEKSKDFSINNFSSGGAPLSIMQTYALPETVLSSYWNKLSLHTSQNAENWTSIKPMGVILDFMKLRAFLAEETSKHGGEVRLSCSYLSHTQTDDGALVHLYDHENQVHELVQTRILVDATGSDRNVLAKNSYNKADALAATGIEYHVEVDSDAYQRYAQTLSFYLGCRWMPQGYAWIFPYKPNLVKVGVIRYFLHEHVVPHEPSIRFYIDRMMVRCFGTSDLPIHDRHGKTLYYTYKHRDIHYSNNVIAIGDAISTLNPLAAEGIRHAMESANIASKCILNQLEKNEGLESFPHLMKDYYGMKWKISEMLMKRIYREPDDRKLDLVLQAFKGFSFEDLLELVFDYKLVRAAKFYVRYKLLALFRR